jgi:hypothetical protein
MAARLEARLSSVRRLSSIRQVRPPALTAAALRSAHPPRAACYAAALNNCDRGTDCPIWLCDRGHNQHLAAADEGQPRDIVVLSGGSNQERELSLEGGQARINAASLTSSGCLKSLSH